MSYGSILMLLVILVKHSNISTDEGPLENLDLEGIDLDLEPEDPVRSKAIARNFEARLNKIFPDEPSG
jgi:hypothetical protein